MNNNIKSTVGDVTSLVSSASREEFSHVAATGRKVASATDTVVVSVTAAASAASSVVTDFTSLCRQAGTLNPAGPGHLHPWPLDLSSGSVRSASLVASAAVIFSRISRSKRSTTLISLSHRGGRILSPDVEVACDVGQWRSCIDHFEALKTSGEQEILVVGSELRKALPETLLESKCVPVGHVPKLVAACFPYPSFVCLPKFLSELGSLCLPLWAAWCLKFFSTHKRGSATFFRELNVK